MTRIYCLVDPRDYQIRYVGKTDQTLARRLAVHYCLARKGSQNYSARWLRQLLAVDLRPVIIVLEETDKGAERERFWVKEFRSAGCRLTNLTDGGEGTTGLKHGPLSPEHKEKLRQLHLGKPKSEEAKARMRKPKSAAARANMSAAQRRWTRPPVTPEACANVSAALKGKPKSPQHTAAVQAALVKARAEGRWHAMHGSTSPNAKVTEPDVIAIRAARAAGVQLDVLAERYGVSIGLISRIALRKCWKHVP